MQSEGSPAPAEVVCDPATHALAGFGICLRVIPMATLFYHCLCAPSLAEETKRRTTRGQRVQSQLLSDSPCTQTQKVGVLFNPLLFADEIGSRSHHTLQFS